MYAAAAAAAACFYPAGLQYEVLYLLASALWFLTTTEIKELEVSYTNAHTSEL